MFGLAILLLVIGFNLIDEQFQESIKFNAQCAASGGAADYPEGQPPQCLKPNYMEE